MIKNASPGKLIILSSVLLIARLAVWFVEAMISEIICLSAPRPPDLLFNIIVPLLDLVYTLSIVFLSCLALFRLYHTSNKRNIYRISMGLAALLPLVVGGLASFAVAVNALSGLSEYINRDSWTPPGGPPPTFEYESPIR